LLSTAYSANAVPHYEPPMPEFGPTLPKAPPPLTKILHSELIARILSIIDF
jgi:hypothetical protein